MLVQYRLALYSILIDLLNAMQACKVVELFLLATVYRLVSLLGTVPDMTYNVFGGTLNPTLLLLLLTAWWNAILRLIEVSVSQ